MKKKIFFKLICLFFLLFTFTNTNALSNDYKDVIGDIVGVEQDGKVNIYLFYSKICPHCHRELEYLETLSSKYKDSINIFTYEVTEDIVNNNYLKSVKGYFQETRPGVPFTVIGTNTFYGFGSITPDEIENTLNAYLKNDTKSSTKNIPILGKIDVSKASITLIAVILGLIDGFNPCAMWILLLLINMTLKEKSRKKMLFVGLTFIITSGVIYFLSMLGIGFIIDIMVVTIIRDLIGVFAIILGIINLVTYLKTRKETGCHVTSKEKRGRIINKINKILSSKSFILGLFGTIVLAISVNLVELACSLGFPTVFLEILSINNILGFRKILYLLIYILFYLIDDLVVFLIAVFTLKSKGISTRYNKLVNLIGGILMLIMGILLIIKPDFVMFNF